MAPPHGIRVSLPSAFESPEQARNLLQQITRERSQDRVFYFLNIDIILRTLNYLEASNHFESIRACQFKDTFGVDYETYNEWRKLLHYPELVVS